MTLDPTGHPSWPVFRDDLLEAWRAAGGGPDARAELVAGVVEQGCPGAWPEAWDRAAAAVPLLPTELAVPDVAGAVLEVLVAEDDRRARGVHHTPVELAERLVALALAGCSDGSTLPLVCDPAVGGGVFLLAAARHLHRQGHPATEIGNALHGADIDSLAVATARAAIAWWAAEVGVAVAVTGVATTGRLVTHDGLDLDPRRWGLDGFDLVVGNPPFLNQLATATARPVAARERHRGGLRAGAYADTATLFVAAGLDLLRPDGRLVLVLPESFLAARDAGPVRARAVEVGRLSDLWVAMEPVFEADVRVCAPVVVAGPASRAPEQVRLWRGQAVVAAGAAAGPVDGDRWGSLLARLHGTPALTAAASGAVLGDLATATAGFRDQFYGLAPHVREAAAGEPSAAAPALVTSGAIDPLTLGWGERPVRFAGERWSRPVVDRGSLLAADPALARWVDARLAPKVLVATQTRVVEVIVDAAGSLVPSVPVIAATTEAANVWLVAAALSAPVTTAWALHEAGGTALTADVVKLSARQVLAVPLPIDQASWAVAARGLSDGTLGAEAFASLMARAYGLAEDDPVSEWWLARLRMWCGVSRG